MYELEKSIMHFEMYHAISLYPLSKSNMHFKKYLGISKSIQKEITVKLY